MKSRQRFLHRIASQRAGCARWKSAISLFFASSLRDPDLTQAVAQELFAAGDTYRSGYAWRPSRERARRALSADCVRICGA
jgi:hypothetical protein